MTTIGTAVLQIIPSLKGVTEAIEKQLDGKTVEVKVAPKVDQAVAKKAGKDAGDTIAKEAKDAVSKGEIGKAVADDVKAGVKKSNAGAEVAKSLTEDVKKSSPGREIAKVIVEGLAEGVKRELPAGGVGAVIVDGIADGVNKGIDSKGLGTQVVGSITKAIKSGNLAGSIKDAVLPGITQIGTNIRSSTAEWSHGIADALRSGDIQGATDDITRAVQGSTNIISGLGEAFGLNTDSFKSGSETAVGYIGDISTSLQGVITKGGEVSTNISDALDQFKTLSDTAVTLSGKDFAGKGTKFGDSLAAISAAAGPIGLTLAAADGLDKVLTNLNIAKFTEIPGSALWFLHQLNSGWEGIKGLSNVLDNLRHPFSAPNADQIVNPTTGLPAVQSNAPAGTRDSGNVPILVDPITKLPLKQTNVQGRAGGGMLSGPGTGTSDSIVLRGSTGEFVVNANATRKNLPLLEIINSDKLPGFSGGGLVAGDQQLRKIIMERFGISNIGGYRPADKYGEHSTGRALDVMVGNDKSKGDAVKDFALANASAIDLKWAIWRQHLYYAGGGGYDMPDRGSPTDNHMDHVHIFSGTGIVKGLRGALAGGDTKNAPAAGGAGAPGAIDATSSDQTAGASPGSSTGGAGPLPSSISGLSSFGLSGLGAGVGTTKQGSDLSVFGNAAASAVSGQVSSALGVLGVGDTPPILKAASMLVGGLKVGGHATTPDGRLSGVSDGSIFNGANPLGSFGSAAPLSATSTAGGTPPPDAAHGSRAGQAPAPQTVFNIRTATVEDAFLAAQRKTNEAALLQTSRF